MATSQTRTSDTSPVYENAEHTKQIREVFYKHAQHFLHLSGVVGFGRTERGLVVYYDADREGEILLPDTLDGVTLEKLSHRLGGAHD